MNSPTPTVTAIVPAYNHESYVGEAIDSIARQTLRPAQLILIDDCSRDATFEKAKALSTSLPFDATVLRNEKNLGLCKTLNRALAMSTSEYVMFLASDDSVPADKLETQVRFLAARPDHAAVYADMMVMNEAGTPLRIDRGFDRTTSATAREGSAPFTMKSVAMGMSTGSIQSGLFRLESVRRVGGFDPSLKHEDLDFNLRLLREFPAAYLFSVGANYRVSPGGLNLRFAEFEHEYDIVIGKHADVLREQGVPPRKLNAAIALRKAENWLNVGKKREGLMHLARCLSLDPSNARALKYVALATAPAVVKRGGKWLLRQLGRAS